MKMAVVDTVERCFRDALPAAECARRTGVDYDIVAEIYVDLNRALWRRSRGEGRRPFRGAA